MYMYKEPDIAALHCGRGGGRAGKAEIMVRFWLEWSRF